MNCFSIINMLLHFNLFVLLMFLFTFFIYFLFLFSKMFSNLLCFCVF